MGGRELQRERWEVVHGKTEEWKGGIVVGEEVREG